MRDQARVVIVGGGIAGCSIAYHLAGKGWTDVLILDKGELTSGSTWHAAGLLPLFNLSYSVGQIHKYSVALYQTLEAETGQATGFRRPGSLSVARTQERLHELKRLASMARCFGVEVEVISPSEAGRRWPLMRSDDLVGALWLPGDGRTNPIDTTRALADAILRPKVPVLPRGIWEPAVSLTAGLLPARLRAAYGLRLGARERLECAIWTGAQRLTWRIAPRARRALPRLLRQRDGALSAELARRPGGFGLGQVPVRLAPDRTTSMVCGFCSTGCSLDVHLKDGRPVNVSPTAEYPVNLGMACPKGWEALTPLRAPDRAVAPLRRDGRGRLEPVSWMRRGLTLSVRGKVNCSIP